jgi:hypothetical protein
VKKVSKKKEEEKKRKKSKEGCGALTAAFTHHLNGYATLLQYHSLP